MNEGEERVRLDDSRLSVCMYVCMSTWSHITNESHIDILHQSVLYSFVFYMCATTALAKPPDLSRRTMMILLLILILIILILIILIQQQQQHNHIVLPHHELFDIDRIQ